MANDGEFTTRLIGFGLSEKEAQLYLHLLKYGLKPPLPARKVAQDAQRRCLPHAQLPYREGHGESLVRDPDS
jgi:hypothetical protein